jgi:hypothetical protein
MRHPDLFPGHHHEVHRTAMSPIITGLLLTVGVSVFVMTMAGRMGALLAMKPENRLDRIPERTLALLRFGFGQKRMVDPEERTAGLMHVAIFAAFLVLAVRTLMMFVMGFSETALEVLTDLQAPFWGGQPELLLVYKVYLLSRSGFTLPRSHTK